MSFQGKLKRFLLILERTRTRPTFAELNDHLEQHGFTLSTRTLQRDIEQIRVELGLEILYDRPSNTYVLPDGADDRNSILPLLERAVLGDLLASDGMAIRSAAPYVCMEHNGMLQGLHHWSALLRAVRERRVVSVTYRRFQKEVDQVFELHPCLLKEYRGRWYVAGPAKGYERPISLGLDRIRSVVITDELFPATERVTVEHFYGPVIGVDASYGIAERVVLSFTPLQGQYVKALPLHTSQTVLQDDAVAFIVALYVVPNYELKQELLGFGASVRVLEPVWLAVEIRNEHLAAAG